MIQIHMRNSFLFALLTFACGSNGEIELNSPPANVEPEPVVEIPEEPAPVVNNEVANARGFEFTIPSDAELSQDGFATVVCEGCQPEYTFAFDGYMDLPANGAIVEAVLYDMTIIVDPTDEGSYPQTFVQATELDDGHIQVVDNIDDEWTGTWITNAARCDASTGHTFLFVMNVNLQTQEAAQYAFRELLSGFRVIK